MIGDVPRYYATVTAGLEEVAWEEVAEKIAGASLVEARQGKLYFDAASEPARLLELRSVENVFAFVGRQQGLSREAGGLGEIRELVATMDFAPALERHAAVHGRKAAPSFRVTSKRSGSHEYTSPEIQDCAGAAIAERFGWKVDLTGFDIEVRADVRDDELLVGLRLSRDTLNRSTRVVHSPASLKPPVAYCMVRLSEPQVKDVFLDPMCGAGTILLERALYGPAQAIIGGDRGKQEAWLTARNAAEHGFRIASFRWDARWMPLAAGSVDRLVTNMPWGRRSGSHTVNRHLYPRFFREISRVIKPDGRAILLSLERRMIERILARGRDLELERTLRVNIAGIHPSIYLIRKQ